MLQNLRRLKSAEELASGCFNVEIMVEGLSE